MTSRGDLPSTLSRLACRILFVLAPLCTFVYSPAPEPFLCNDGRQISPSWVCDGYDDCTDGADEIGCGDATCSALQFTCLDASRCVSEQYVCDGDFDCNDHSDEQDCPLRECEGNEFRCDNNRCIHSTYKCDGQNDCGDASDEGNCIPVDECENMYMCDNTTRECIPLSWVCDGSADCRHAMDEMDCDGVDDCERFSMFNCSKGGCVKATLVCDGTRDCPHEDDDSDEDCPKRECDPGREFECRHANGDRECLPLHWSCDGEVDCFDEIGSDEVNCISSCEETEFNCVTGSQCVNNSVQCDGHEDCDDGSDEYLCGLSDTNHMVNCHMEDFPCHDNQECIGATQLCDGGPPECHDGSDEAPLWCNGTISGVNECEGNSHGCEHRCHDTDHAYYCTCEPGYILDDNRKNCSDINECDETNRCSQLCCNYPGSYECLCVDGYTLTENGVCKPLGRQGYLLLMDKVDIRSMQPVAGGGQVRKLVTDLSQTFAMDYHLRLRRIFWSERTFQGTVIKTAFLNGSDPTVIIDTGLVSPHGLAIDWISNKIYWTDASRSHVTVAELDGSRRNVLISDDMKKPRGIAVDPTFGYMYWTDWGTSPRIERASMDGTSRIILHSTNIIWPNALTIDYATQTLYWIDAKLDFIESSFMDGSLRTVLYREFTRHFRPFGLTLFKDKLYMVDIDAREVRSFDVKKKERELPTVYSAVVEPMSVVAVHSVRQPQVRLKCSPNSVCGCDNITEPVINPCEDNNGGCEYMCVLRAVDHMHLPNSADQQLYSCLCPIGHRIHPNGKSCLHLDQFLLLASNEEVYFVSLDVPHPVTVEIPLNHSVVVSAITWDSRDNKIYFTDLGHRSISSANKSGKNQQVIIEAGTVGRPVGIALDWLHNRLYWTDSDWNTIESSGLDGSWRTVVIYSGLDKPRDVVVDPERGLMFWSDWGEDRPQILRAGLDGTSKEVLVRANIDTPNGLALDYEGKRVYWADGVLDTIEMIHYDGSNRQTIVQFDLDTHPSGLDFYGNALFWSTWKDHSLMTVNVSLSTQWVVMIDELVQVRDVNVFHRHRNHSATTPCRRRNGGCSHICVTKARNSGAVKAACMCPLGYPLLDNGKTCASEINGTLLFPTGSAIHQVSLDIEEYIAETISPVEGAAQTIIAVAMDPVNDIIYYADIVSFGVHRMNLLDQTDTEILYQHPTAITSLAVDFASQNLYFIDSHERRLEVARTDGSNRRVIHNGLVNPTGLAMDPVSLSLFYIDTGNPEQGEQPKIYSSAMDGSAQTVVVATNLHRPLYIAVDNRGVNGRIFWTDSYYNRIMTASFDGRNVRPILAFGDSDGAALVHGLAFYKEYLYFTDVGRRRMYKSNLHGDKTVYRDGYSYLSDVEIAQPYQGNVRGCTNSSRCEYLCLPNPNVPSKQTCTCPTGIEVAADGRSCPKVPNTFLLVAAQYSLRRIALDNPDGHYVDVTLYDFRDGYEVNAVDYLLTGNGEGFVFCAETRPPTGRPGDSVWRSRIIRRDLYSTNPETTFQVLLFDVGIIEDLAVDWTTGNVYFTRNSMDNQSYIAVMDMHGEYVHKLVSTDIHKPRGIALHPYEHLMFWTDYGRTPKIESAAMDGTGRRVLVSSRSEPFNLQRPNDVVVDLNTDLVYFTDGLRGLIGAVTISGNSGRVIVTKIVDNPELSPSEPDTSYIRRPCSMAIRHLDDAHQDNDVDTEETEMFWTDPEFRTISAADLVTTGGETEGIRKSNLRSVLSRTTDYKPLAVQFVSSDGHRENELMAQFTTPCSHRLCRNQICVNINSTHFQCLCPDSATNCRSLVHRIRDSPSSPPPPVDPPYPPDTPTTPPSPAPGTTATDPLPDDGSGGTGSDPTTPDNENRQTTSTTGAVSPAEQQVGGSEEEEEEEPVKKVGIGLGTVVGVVVVAFAVFVVVTVYFMRKHQATSHIHEHLSQYRESSTRLRSLSSSTSSSSQPTTPSRKSNLFRLPNKQSNVLHNNSKASAQNVCLQALNPSTNVNEFVEKPEVYDLGPVPLRSKRTKTPPDSPSLKKEPFCKLTQKESAEKEDKTQTTEFTEPSCVSATDASSLSEEGDEPVNDDEVFLMRDKPTRSCLSSVSDSSQTRPKKGLSVTFAEGNDLLDVTDSLSPPPPIPPRAFEDDVFLPDSLPPPRPPKLPPLNPPHHREDKRETIDDDSSTSTSSLCTSEEPSDVEVGGAPSDVEVGEAPSEGEVGGAPSDVEVGVAPSEGEEAKDAILSKN